MHLTKKKKPYQPDPLTSCHIKFATKYYRKPTYLMSSKKAKRQDKQITE